jgi:hypothetical protein
MGKRRFSLAASLAIRPRSSPDARSGDGHPSRQSKPIWFRSAMFAVGGTAAITEGAVPTPTTRLTMAIICRFVASMATIGVITEAGWV